MAIKEKNELIGRLVRKYLSLGIEVQFSPKDGVKLPEEPAAFATGGFFSEDDRILAVSLKGRSGLDTLLHEDGHVDQWIEGKFMKGWDNAFWDYLEGKRISKERAAKSMRKILACERDCEQRTIKKMKRLNMDAEQYTRRANSYLTFYPAALNARRWYTNKPYEIPGLLKLMPSDRIFTLEEALNPSEKILEKQALCFKKKRSH